MKSPYKLRFTASLMVVIMLFSSFGEAFAVYAKEDEDAVFESGVSSKTEKEEKEEPSQEENSQQDTPDLGENPENPPKAENTEPDKNAQNEDEKKEPSQEEISQQGTPDLGENPENPPEAENTEPDKNAQNEDEKKEPSQEGNSQQDTPDLGENPENPPEADTPSEEASPEASQEQAQTTSSVDTSKDYYYLSDLKMEKGSYSGYNGFQIDNSPSGKKIELFVDGERMTFDKGIGAHATSSIIYNISDYSDTFTNFTVYLGVDARQGNNGDGVKFTISVSDDKSHWDDIYQTDALKGSHESVFVDLNVKGKKYLKLFAHDNGSNGNDHSVYGDARLKKKDYNIHQDSKGPFKRIGEYDKLLSEKPIEENLKNHMDMIYERELVNRIGYHTINKLYENPDYKEAIDFLCEEKPLSYFINGGPLIRDGGAYPEKTIIAFAKIYNKHKEKLKDSSENDFYLRLAISVASAYCYPANVRFWMDKHKEEDPLQRFETYIDLSKPGGAMDDAGKTTSWSGEKFRQLPIAMMRWVVDARMNEDEFQWLANYALETRDALDKDGSQKFLDAYTYIEYKGTFKYDDEKYYSKENHDKWNDKYHFDKYFSDYGTRVHRLWIVFAEGAVCGGLAKTYANLAEVFGRPSVVVGQPGHAATVTWDYDGRTKRYVWRIQNDISSWGLSHNEFNNYLLNWGLGKAEAASYVPMASDAVTDYQNFTEAYSCVLLANSYPNKDKETLYRQALKAQDFNLDAWEGLVKVKLEDTSLKSKDYLKFAQEIMDTLTYYPLPMDNLLNSIKGKITEVTDIAEFDLLRLETLQTATQATVNEVYQPNVSVGMAQFLLKQDNNQLASFSFDGEDAGKIVMNSKYDGSAIRVRYSLDGGTDWKESNDHKIPLSSDELDSLSADKDVLVGLVGTPKFYTIDLENSKSPAQDNLYLNDYENLFITSSPYLEYSTDSGKHWNPYMPELTSTTRFPGKQDILLRYKSHGTFMQSEASPYSFHEDNDTPQRTYLPLKNVKLETFSSQQDKGKTAAKNLIDGNINTHWHSAYKIIDKKEYVVSFAEPMYISALEYFPHAPNGRWKDIVVSSSMDNQAWEEVGRAHLENDESIKSISLDTSHPMKYLKIKGLNSWGKSPPEEDKYFSGKMLNFYVDTTKLPVADASISYSTMEKTNKDVVATITLPPGCTMAEGSTSHTFTQNGEYLFKYRDQQNNLHTALAKVTWIRKAVLTGTVTYSTTQPTYDHVVATIGNFPYNDVYVSNNKQSPRYTFTRNGEFLFELADSYGNTGKVKASVQNIIGSASKINVEYSSTEWTDQPVTAALKAGWGEKFTVLNNGGSKEYTFTKNQSFVFEVQDSDGKQFNVTATVDWIDPSKSKVKPSFSTTDKTTEPVTVTLSIDPEAHEIINNDGSNSYTFTRNGTFVFHIRLRDSGKIVFYEVKVDNIKKKSSKRPGSHPADTSHKAPQQETEQLPDTKPELIPSVSQPENGYGNIENTFQDDALVSPGISHQSFPENSTEYGSMEEETEAMSPHSQENPQEETADSSQEQSVAAGKDTTEEQTRPSGIKAAVLIIAGLTVSFAVVSFILKSGGLTAPKNKATRNRRKRK